MIKKIICNLFHKKHHIPIETTKSPQVTPGHWFGKYEKGTLFLTTGVCWKCGRKWEIEEAHEVEDSCMKQLKNINHTFDIEFGEIGVTFRKGWKWSNVKKRTLLELWNCPKAHSGDCTVNTCKIEGIGMLIGSWEGVFDDIPESVLALGHNKSARNKNALRKMLKTAYGEFDEKSELFTALIYERRFICENKEEMV